jgi:hypothetical protein
MNSTLQRYLVSSATTFVTAFLISVGAQLTLVHMTPETLGWGIVASIGATAARAAIKAVIETVSGSTGDPTLG